MCVAAVTLSPLLHGHRTIFLRFSFFFFFFLGNQILSKVQFVNPPTSNSLTTTTTTTTTRPHSLMFLSCYKMQSSRGATV